MRGCVSFIVGAAAGYGLAIAGLVVWLELGGRDFEGAASMQTAFFYGPALALVGGIAAVLAFRRKQP